MATFSDLFARLDPDPRVRGKQFEHVCKWFLTNDPTYKNTLRKVWLWSEWTSRWGADSGIDLVAEDHDGRLWAIQAKAYAPENTVTKADVDKFLAESSRAVFSYRLLIATTDKLHHVARRTINDQEKKVAFVGLSDLLTSEVDWRTNPLDMRPSPPPKPAKPREHQREAIRDVVKGFTKSDRGQLIMACGTGKTLTSLFIKEKLDAERTLVLVPSLSLLKQTMQVWRVNAKVLFEALPVCSDETVGLSGEDAAVAHTSELGVPVTTDPHDIAAFLRRRSGPRVVFSTYQSSPQIAAAFALGRVPAFDMVIADEAHRCAGSASTDFATVLDPSKIKAKRRLFMTATPRYFTGRVIEAAQEADLEVASMDDETKFGTVFHRLPFGEAIKRDLLTDYQVMVVGVDDATYLQWAEKGVLVTRDGKKITDARTLAGQIGLAKVMRKYDLHRTISFHSRVARAREFAAEMPEVIAWMPARQRPKGALWSSYASGEMTAGERHVRLQHLSRLGDGERGLLTNARCLSEGVDVPTLDGVAFIDPRRSEVDIVQAVGRAIRRSEHKNVGTIVIPVFIDTGEDPEVALDDSAFKPVWDVIKALRSHDEELGEQLDEIRRQLGRQGQKPRLTGKIHIDLPVGVGTDFARAFDVRLVEQTTASWEFWFGLLEKYVEENGHARVIDSDIVDGFPLGKWAHKQRHRKRTGLLPVRYEDRLSALDGWSWEPHDDSWEKGFIRLQQYVEAHGHARVPQTHRTRDGFNLGAWVASQRSRYREGVMSAERERLLEEVHPTWSWEPHDDSWEKGFIRLQQYVEAHGHARVPHTHRTRDGFNLGAWVGKQRSRYREGVMSAERERLLEEVHPTWSWGARADRWEEAFSKLVEYVADNDHALVPDDYKTEGGFALGKWVGNQRTFFAKGKLSPNRVTRLEDLHPTWTWNAIIDKWEEGFDHLVSFMAENGHASVPQGYKTADGYALGNWVTVLRGIYRKGKLEVERQHRIESLDPTWSWDPRTDQWEEGFALLREYVKENGDARVPGSYKTVNGFALGGWVVHQRSNYREGKLEADRRRRLEDLHPTWSWDPFTDMWEEGFEHLRAYIDENGHTRVPVSYRAADGYPLGTWVANQRAFCRNDKLDADRQKRLASVHPTWTWNARAVMWEEGFDHLCTYIQEFGDACPPYAYVVDNYPLGVWVATQRTLFKKGKVSEDRVERLRKLPGWAWSVRAR